MRELTIDEFAKLHGKTRDAVESQIRRKRIKAKLIKTTMVVYRYAIPAGQSWPKDRRFKKNGDGK